MPACEPKTERNWAVWREYHTTDKTLAQAGEPFGMSASLSQNMVRRLDRVVRQALERTLGLPISDAVRDGTLGVEFVFTYDDLVADERDWKAIGSYKDRRYVWDEERGRHRVISEYVGHELDEYIVYKIQKED